MRYSFTQRVYKFRTTGNNGRGGASFNECGHPWQAGNRRETDIFATDLIGHLPALRRYATALTGRAAEADDLVQDCIERALRGQDTLRAQDRMGAWLRAILHNLVRDDQRRRRDRGPMVDIADMESDLALSIPPQDSSETHDFIRATQTLSAEHRQVLMLVGVEGLSYRAIADELGVPIGTVMSRLARARERLRAALEAPPARAEIVALRPQRMANP